MFVLFCCFTHMEGHTAYMQPRFFPQVLYTYTYFTIMILYSIAYFFSQLVHSLINAYIGSFAHAGANTFFKEDHIHLKQVLKGFHSDILLSFFHYFFKGAQSTTVSLKMTLDSCQINAALPYVRGLYKMMPLYARKNVTLCQERHIIGKI